MSLNRSRTTCTPALGNHVQVEEVEDFFETDGLKLHRAYREETHWAVDQRRFVSGGEPPIQYGL